MKRIFKRILLSVTLCSLIASFLCSCTQNKDLPAVTEPTDATESTTTESAAPEATTTESTTAEYIIVTEKTTAPTAEGDFEYMDVRIWDEESGCGEPISYPELRNCFKSYSDDMNLVKFIIIEKYTSEEAYQITSRDVFLDRSTLFKAKIIYDYLRDEEVDIDVNIGFVGNENSQFENYPLFAKGYEYVSKLSYLFDGSFAMTEPDLLFVAKKADGVEYAYHVLIDFIKIITPDGINLDLGISDDERYEYTSTNNNPVLYVHKYKMTELADFLRNDWTNAELEFTDFSAVQ